MVFLNCKDKVHKQKPGSLEDWQCQYDTLVDSFTVDPDCMRPDCGTPHWMSSLRQMASLANLLGCSDVQLSQGGLQVRVHLKVQQGLSGKYSVYVLWGSVIIFKFTWEMAFSTSSGSSLLALMIFPLVRAMTIFSEIYKYKIIWSNISWQFHSAL